MLEALSPDERDAKPSTLACRCKALTTSKCEADFGTE
jgi:hypothetical protein